MQIDPFEFARRRDRRQGEIVAAEMGRVAALGWQALEGTFDVQGGGSDNGPSWIDVRVAARLRTICQRCLADLDVEVKADAHLELAASEAAVNAAEDDDIERIDGSRPLEVAALIEDELILALPMVGRHEVCEATVVPDRPQGPLSKALGAWTSKRLAD